MGIQIRQCTKVITQYEWTIKYFDSNVEVKSEQSLRIRMKGDLKDDPSILTCFNLPD